ncbi:Protein FAR1-RELATED SEQUENCE 5 [Linum perenne]
MASQPELGDEEIYEDNYREYEKLRNLTEIEWKALRFQTDDECVAWYVKYGKAFGFSVRKRDVKTNKQDVVTSRVLVCNAEGTRSENPEKQQQKAPRLLTRFDCSATVKFKLDNSTSTYQITEINNVHKHKLAEQRLRHHMPANREVSDMAKDSLRHARQTVLKQHEAYNLEVHKHGGHAYVGYTKKYAFNQCHRDDLKTLSEGDAAIALAYLKSKSNYDDKFFMEYTISEDKMLEKVFWADSISITDFAAFGDVLLFHSTYKKNRYNMPFVIFSGINHHYSTCIFGSALLQHEKDTNYVWLLDTLTKAMGGKQPKAVITDGDKAMALAISKAFPNATHRLCSWHLNKNVTQNVKNEKFQSGWEKFVDASYNEGEFTEKWDSFVEECELQSNTWVRDHLFKKRKQWAHIFAEYVFWWDENNFKMRGVEFSTSKLRSP